MNKLHQQGQLQHFYVYYMKRSHYQKVFPFFFDNTENLDEANVSDMKRLMHEMLKQPDVITKDQ